MPARDDARRRPNETARGGRGAGRLRRWATGAVAAATAVAGVGLASAAPAAAAGPACTIVWAAGTTGSWGQTTNWSPQAVPGSAGRTSDRACIPAGTTVTIDSGDYTLAGLGTSASSGSIVGTDGNLYLTGTDTFGSWVGGLTLNRLRVDVGAGVVLTTGGALAINKSASLSGGGTLSGSGSTTVDGDISVVGGTLSTANMVITQTAGHTVTIASDSGTAGVVQSTTIDTQSPVTVSGTVSLFAGAVKTTGQLTLSPGASITGPNGVLQAARVTTTAGAQAVSSTELRITGTTSSLGADVTVGGVGVTAGGSFSIPAGRTVTLDQTTWPVTTTVAGTLSGAGTLAIVSSQMNVAATGTLSVGHLSMSGGTLGTASGATVSLGKYTATWGSWYNNAAASIGAGGFNLLSSTSGQGYYDGASTGSIALDGDLLVSGGFASTQNQVLTQTAGHTATIESRVTGPFTRSPRWQSVKLSTPNDVTLRGNVELFAGRITTAADLVVENGTTFGYSNATLEARGIVTGASTVSLNDATLKLTGTTSAVGGSLNVSTLELASGSRLLMPSGGLLKTIGAGTLNVPLGSTFGGSGGFDGTLTNNGTVSPGDTPAGPGTGTLTTVRYQQGATGVLDIDVDSSGNDTLDATDTTFGNRPVLAGTVSISRLGGYTPAVGTELTVLTSGYQPVLSGITTTDDLADGKFTDPTVVGNAVVVSRGPLTTTAPSAPTLSLTPGVASISATVGAPASDGGSPVTAYVVTCSPACGTNEVAAPGVVNLTGLTGGTTYTVSAIARNAVGDSAATTALATPLAPTTTATPTATKLVLANSATSGKFTVTCTRNSGLITACSVVAKAANGTVLGVGGPVTVPAGATSIPVTVTLTSAGLSASKAFGGVVATVTSTVTPQSGAVASATSSLRIVRATTKQPVLVGSLFSSGGTLTSAGKTYLTGIARKAAGGKALRCDGYWSKNVSKATAYKLGLDRATKVCAFIKSTITKLKLKPIGKYVVYSYGLTKQVSGTAAKNRRLVLTLSS
jgi:fibronectin-binding autotransporter adhesin